MLDDVHVPVMQTSGTTNTKAKTANDVLILFDSLSGDGTYVLFRLTFMIFSRRVSCGASLRQLFFCSSLTTERPSSSRIARCIGQ